MLIVELQPAAVSHSFVQAPLLASSHVAGETPDGELLPSAQTFQAIERHRLVFSDDYFLLNLPDSCLIDR